MITIMLQSCNYTYIYMNNDLSHGCFPCPALQVLYIYLIYTNTSKLKAMYHACIQMASTLQTTKTQCTITKDIYCIDESLYTHIHANVMWYECLWVQGKSPTCTCTDGIKRDRRRHTETYTQSTDTPSINTHNTTYTH